MTIDFEKDQQKIAENTDLNALSVHVEKIMDLDKQLEHQENVMKELNLPKYRALGLTEFEERLDKGTEELFKHEVIKDWTKRNDQRHHAMDALTVAFTTHNHIQYINNLNARRDSALDNHPIIKNIENGLRIPPVR